jgi:atypical dual specificity phosphatase
VLRVVVLDRGFSFGPSPDSSELGWLSKEYTHVVVLTFPHEVKYDVGLLRDSGVEVLKVPVPDFRSPPLLDLAFIVEWVLDKVSSGDRVYVHCARGYGRSATVAAAYLIRRYGKSWAESVDRVRKLREGSLESIEQLSVLKAYEIMLRYLNPAEITGLFECLDKQVRDHVSKMLQIGLKNSDVLSRLTKTSQDLIIQELFNSINQYIKSLNKECSTLNPPVTRDVDQHVSTDVLKTYTELVMAVDELKNQCVEDLEIKVKENNLVESVLYCSADLMSSCSVIKKRMEEVLTKMCEILNCSVKTVALGFLNIRARFLGLRQASPKSFGPVEE